MVFDCWVSANTKPGGKLILFGTISKSSSRGSNGIKSVKSSMIGRLLSIVGTMYELYWAEI